MRFQVLDVFRFVAAFAVVIHHYRVGLSVNIDAYTPIFARGQMFVDFFFILSGFVIYHTYYNKVGNWRAYGYYMQKRFARIYPLHFLTLLFYVVFAFAIMLAGMKANAPERYATDAIWTNLLLIQAWGMEDFYTFNGVAWSLSAEFFVYLLFPIIVFILAKFKFIGGMLFALGIVLVMQAIRHHYGLTDWTKASFDYGNFRALPTFMAGASLAYLAQRKTFNVHWFWVVLGGIFALSLLHFEASDNMVVLGFILLTFLTINAEISHPVVFAKDSWVPTLGDASYSIYMLHPICKTLLLTAGKFLFKVSPMVMNLLVLVATVLSLVSAILVFRWIETPSRRWLSKKPWIKQVPEAPQQEHAKA